MSYNLNDPDDIARLEFDFSRVTVSQWEEYISIANQGHNWRKFDLKALRIGLSHVGTTYRITPKQMRWAMNVVSSIEAFERRKDSSEELRVEMTRGLFRQQLKHCTLRVAWHDNNWNGTICKDPEANHFCCGYQSLLSDRIRKRKAENLQKEKEYAGKNLTDIDYVPPCFWSININGSKRIPVTHDNPAAPELVKISEQLEPQSMYSWPFGISFNRTAKELRAEGSYPSNLDNVRIEYFREKIKPKKSVGFIYAKFSNPFTDEERQYLLVGAAVIDRIGDTSSFGPQSAIDNRRKHEKYKNFPSKNWALQFNFDETTQVMMPYHEYLGKSKGESDPAAAQRWLDKVKVAIDEPELNHCFKYVAMDIDDDEAIYLLSKMRKKLIDCSLDGVISPADIQERISKVESLSKQCWEQRGYFPGFLKLSRLLTEDDDAFEEIFDCLENLDGDDLTEKLKDLISNPRSDATLLKYRGQFSALRDSLQERAISIDQFLQLCMLNLSNYQFERILFGKICKYDTDQNEVPFTERTPLAEVCDNPYLLVEEYVSETNSQNIVTGEEKDAPIELFKVDIAFFPDPKGLPRIDFQRRMIVSDNRRLRCIILDYLRSLEQTGNCFEEASELENALRQYPLFYKSHEFNLKPNILKEFDIERQRFFEQYKTKLKVVDANDTRYYYQNSIYQAECDLGDTVKEMMLLQPNDVVYRKLNDYINTSIDRIKATADDSFNELDYRTDRTNLYANIFKQRVFVLAGGPGSGKSHELLNILQELQDQGENYLLLTPTGKAALRLKSDTNYQDVEASTIDKWLADVKSDRISKSAIASINNLVIDEMSMVDLLKVTSVENPPKLIQ